MHPILFRVGSFPVYTYTALLDLGIILGIALACMEGQRLGYGAGRVLDAALWALVGGVLGGRLVYLASRWPQYASRPLAAFSLWGGGLAFHGALAGGAAGVALYSLVRRSPTFWQLADLAALSLPVGQTLGWLGALCHGANYGRISYSGWAWELPDLYGITLPRFPTQLLGSVLALAILLFLLFLRRRVRLQGALFCVYLLVNSGAFFLLEYTRGDRDIYWGPLRLSQIAYLAEGLIAAALLGSFVRRRGDRGSL